MSRCKSPRGCLRSLGAGTWATQAVPKPAKRRLQVVECLELALSGQSWLHNSLALGGVVCDEESFNDANGTQWVKTGPCGKTQQRAAHSVSLAALSDSLAEVKVLFQAQHDRDLEDFEDEQEPLFDDAEARRGR